MSKDVAGAHAEVVSDPAAGRAVKVREGAANLVNERDAFLPGAGADDELIAAVWPAGATFEVSFVWSASVAVARPTIRSPPPAVVALFAMSVVEYIAIVPPLAWMAPPSEAVFSTNVEPSTLRTE